MKYSVEQIRDMVFHRLSEKRYNHSIKVAECAKMIAEKTTADPEKLYIAGLLHDIAKELSNEEILRLCEEKAEKYVPSFAKRNAHSLHGIASACIAYEDFEIRDRSILTAIAFHSGRAAMHTEEKIIFLSDVISHEAKFGIDTTPIWQQHDIDSAILVLCSIMIKYCVENNVRLDERTQDSFDYVIEHYKKDANSEKEENPELTLMKDKLFDKAIDIYASHRIKIDSATNIRDAGGYETKSGKSIKKGKLIRSGMLSKLTKEDAKKLRDMGINCIIDLRTDSEAEAAPDINTDGFKYFHCPLPSFETTDYQDRCLDYTQHSISEEESAWYEAEYLQYVDFHKLYRDILLDSKSILSLRKVFDILTDDDLNGVLFHCVSGKDRTGIVAILIQFALGVSRTDAVCDYYASSVPYYMATENAALLLNQNGYNNNLADKARALFGIGDVVVLDFKKWWQENELWTIEEYVSDVLNISQDKIDKLHEKFL